MHFAGDAFAHAYVNNYAGGVFEIGQDRTKGIELRHFRLEKYIDQHLDYSFDPAVLRVPADFLSRELIQYDYGAGGGPRVGDFYASAEADPEGFLRQATQRLRHGGTAAPVMTLLTMLDLARVARARAPGQEAAERARLDNQLRTTRALEQAMGVASESFVFDQRSADWARFNRDQRATPGRLPPLSERGRSFQQARALTIFTAGWASDIEIASAISRPRSNSAFR